MPAASPDTAPPSTSRYPTRTKSQPPEPPFGPETPGFRTWVGQALLAEIRSVSGASSAPHLAERRWASKRSPLGPWRGQDFDLIGQYFRQPSTVPPAYKVGQELVIRHPLVSDPTGIQVGEHAIIQRSALARWASPRHGAAHGRHTARPVDWIAVESFC
jgi:hypothetical protein